MVRYYSNSRWWGWTNPGLDDVCDGLDIGRRGTTATFACNVKLPRKATNCYQNEIPQLNSTWLWLVNLGVRKYPLQQFSMLWLERPSSPLCRSMAWSFFWIHLVTLLQLSLKSKSSPKPRHIASCGQTILRKESFLQVGWYFEILLANRATLTWFPTRTQVKGRQKHPKNQIEPKHRTKLSNGKTWTFGVNLSARQFNSDTVWNDMCLGEKTRWVDGGARRESWY